MIAIAASPLLLWLREKGAGMAGHVGQITSPITGKKQFIPRAGFLPTETEQDISRWQQWKRFLRADIAVLVTTEINSSGRSILGFADAIGAPPDGDDAFAAVREDLDDLLRPERFVGRAPEQVERCAALGANVSANVYYLHELSHIYAEEGIGHENKSLLAASLSKLNRVVPADGNASITSNGDTSSKT